MTSMPSAPSAPSATAVTLRARTLHACLRNEYSKMRHLRIGVAASLLLLGVCALTVFWPMGSGLGEHLDDPDGYDWKLLLTSLHSAVMCTAPILLAVMASRQTEIEHSGNGWLASATAGAGPGRLCRAKFLALGILVTPMPVVWSAIVLAFGKAAGITAPFPAARTLGLIVSLMVINLAILAFHLVLSAMTENQLLPLGVGLGGILLAIFGQVLPGWLLYLSPWTYYSLVTPVDFVGVDLIYLDPMSGLAGTGVLAAVGSALFLGVTAHLDHQEA